MSQDFESTDSVRTGKPLRHVKIARFPTALSLRLGGVLPAVEVAYETYGTLDETRGNAVLICHAISGDSHVSRHDDDDDPGWWDTLVGPGKPVDTNRLFVICSNVLGGCRGSTGPSSIDPGTKKRYGRDFPLIAVEDMVDVQKRLVDLLGIERLRAVVGGSLGGHQTLCWATRYPDMVQTAVVLGSSSRLTAQALAFDVVGRNAIQTDPKFHDGQYYETEDFPQTGLAIARMLGHITYLSSESMTRRFDLNREEPREIATEFEKRFSVGSYLAYQGDKFVGRFDANSYVAISLTMDHFDMGGSHEERTRALRPAKCNWLVISFSSDWLFPPIQSRELVAAMTSLDQDVSYCEVQTDAGHDGFLLPADIGAYAPVLRAKLGAPVPGSPNRSPSDDRILELISEGSSVLDLGCGEGDLLRRLRERGAARLVGVDLSTSVIAATTQHNVDAIQCDINLGLPRYNDDAFDYVVISSTLQVVPNVERLLDDSLRVGKQVIVSFANFGYEPLRTMFAQEGRVPKAPGPYSFDWYDTPNRRFPSIRDMLDLCERMGVAVEDARYYDDTRGIRIAASDDPNLKADTAVLILRKR